MRLAQMMLSLATMLPCQVVLPVTVLIPRAIRALAMPLLLMMPVASNGPYAEIPSVLPSGKSSQINGPALGYLDMRKPVAYGIVPRYFLQSQAGEPACP